jgi:3-methyladenine DNA glycosylase/8-oxoguanine DNA glycosylase
LTPDKVPAADADRDTPAIRATFHPDGPLDLVSTLAPLRHGPGDATIRFDRGSAWRATRTPEGPATVLLEPIGGDVRISAWGPGAGWAVAAAPRLLGSEDRPEAFDPPPGLLRELHRRNAGLRIGRSDAVLESLVPAVIEQKVTGHEARRAYGALLRAHGEAAPGPGGLRLPPSPEALRRIPQWSFHPLGLEERRAGVIRRAADRAAWLEAAASLAAGEARARLQSIPGIGPWTAAETARSAFGDADAISLGDYHLPNLVCWALAGEPRGTDERMLELLEPYRGQRGRVQRLLESAGITIPRYGPRMPVRSIDRL